MHRLLYILPLYLASSLAAQQLPFASRVPLPSTEARVLSAPSTVERDLAQVDMLTEARAWDEAVDALLRLVDIHAAEIVEVADGYHLPVTTVCHVRISRWPTEGLAAYRQRVDVVARSMLEAALANRDAVALRQVVRTYFSSSVGDDALLALADIALEQGDTNTARGCLLQLSAATCAADGRPWGVALAGVDVSQSEVRRVITKQIASPSVPTSIKPLVYPDTDLSLAEIQARLVVVSIRQRSLSRAESELAVLELAFPEAEGRIAGRNAKLSTALADVLAAARAWPAPRPAEDWPSGSGGAAGGVVARTVGDVSRTVWRRDLPKRLVQTVQPAAEVWLGQQMRLAPPSTAPSTSSFVQPLVSGDAVVYQSVRQHSMNLPASGDWVALNRHTGLPLFGQQGILGKRYAARVDDSDAVSGDLQLPNPARRAVAIGDAQIAIQFQIQLNERPVVIRGNPFDFGNGDYSSLPARDSRPRALLAGNLFYQVSEAEGETPQGIRVVARDLAAEGKLRSEIIATKGQRFTGPPVMLGDRIFLPVQTIDSSGLLAVACYSPTSGRLLWQTAVASITANAERPADMLIAGSGKVYLPTDAGVVVALDAIDGQVAWARSYARGSSHAPNDLSQVSARSHGSYLLTAQALVCAPVDCPVIYALDPASGQLLWTNQQAWNVEHLLGISAGRLVATGGQLWMLDPVSGATQFVWPDAVGAGATGSGRGCLAGGELFWPTKKVIYAFDVNSGQQSRKPIPLAPLGDEGGASVTPCGDGLLVATQGQLTLLGRASIAPPQPDQQPSSKEAEPEAQLLGARGDTKRLFAVE